MILQLAFIISLIVLFVHACTWEGMIFHFVYTGLYNLPDKIKKPLFDCPICMCPWWGTLIMIFGCGSGEWQAPTVFQFICILCVSGGINTVLLYIVNQAKAISKTLNEYECNCTSKEQVREERIKRLTDYGVDKKFTAPLEGSAGYTLKDNKK